MKGSRWPSATSEVLGELTYVHKRFHKDIAAADEVAHLQ
jgi:hypothetical protein